MYSPIPAVSRSHIRAARQSASLDAVGLERGIKLMSEQICKVWGKGKNQQQWSQVHQEALGCLVLWVHDHVVSSTSHTLCTPFPTLLSSSVWTDTQTWYTCSVTWSLPPDIKNMLSIMGKAQDAKIAETMLTAENSLLSAKRHMGRMVDVVVIEQIRMDCTGCRTALGCQMAQQSSWFGVCIETSSIVTATSP